MKYLKKYIKCFEMYKSVWTAINSDYEDDNFIYLDAYKTYNDNEEGKVIAKIDKNTEEVIYLDKRAKTDSYAQEEIENIIDEYFTPEKKLEISSRKYNL